MENIKRIIRRFYTYKSITISTRIDQPTALIIEELKNNFNLNTSEVIRLSVWLVAILFDPAITLDQILTKEAIEKLKKNENISVIDALQSIGKLLEEKVEKYLKYGELYHYYDY